MSDVCAHVGCACLYPDLIPFHCSCHDLCCCCGREVSQ